VNVGLNIIADKKDKGNFYVMFSCYRQFRQQQNTRWAGFKYV